MRHILSVLMENESGAMSRVVGLFSARGYNIDSLSGIARCAHGQRRHCPQCPFQRFFHLVPPALSGSC